jgi:hypothetical protein
MARKHILEEFWNCRAQRPLRRNSAPARNIVGRRRCFALLLVLLAWTAGCGGTVSGSGGGGGGGGGGGEPQNVVVKITPASATAVLGASVNFQASVTGAANTSVSWSVNGVAGGGAQSGTISAAGQYSAPSAMLAVASVTVTATSAEDASASDSATVTITSDVVVGISPLAAGLPLGGTLGFTASITSSGKPSTAVNWSVNGVNGGDATNGTIVSNGADSAVYAAPATLPSAPTVSVTATSVADPSKSASASVGIGCTGTNGVAPASASVPLGQTQIFAASLCVGPGTAVVWDVNGVVGGSAALGTVTNTGAATTIYTAPADLPSPSVVTIGAMAAGISASAAVTVVSNVTISVTPSSGNIVVQQRASFTALVSNTSDTSVVWAVNGVVNGNTVLGQVCVTNSNPCVPPAGTATTAIDFLAPATVPSANPVAFTATSNADPSKSANAQIKIVGTGGGTSNVTITPATAFLPPSGSSSPSQLQFTASVTGTSNTDVIWSVAGGVSGTGCSGTACGTIDANGVYSAPDAAPSPNAISVIATSLADLSQFATATVAITSGPAIEQILPSSVMAGVAADFTLAVNGAGFVAGRGDGASVILVNGEALTTICNSSSNCTATLPAQDAGNPGALTIQVQTPGNPAILSNPVFFVIVPFTLTRTVISLNSSQPEIDGNDIVVFEPTTAGLGPSQINVDFAGPITAGATCNFDSSPITLLRPSSGTATFSICIHGNTLDSSFFYQFTGPPAPDISIVSSELDGLFPNTIELDLTISSATLPGVRSLFITTPNNDQAVATGLVEVQ